MNAAPVHPRNATRRKVSLRGGTEIGSRAPVDSQPAWMTPGEFVEPVESVEMFRPLLEAVRRAGLKVRAANMSAGGSVPDMGGGAPPAGGPDHYSLGGWVGHHAWLIPLLAAAAPFAAPGLLGAAGLGEAGATGTAAAAGAGLSAAKASLPVAAGVSALGGGDQQPQSDPAAAYYALRRENTVPGYAFGGPVFGRDPYSRQPAPAPASPYETTPQPTATGGPGGGGGGAGPQSWNYAWDKNGFQTRYNPNDYWSGLVNNQNAGPYGALNRAIGQYGEAGYYDPGGSAKTEQAMRDKAMQDARAYSNQAYLGAQVGGLDPGAAAAYRLTALTQAGKGVGEALTNYRANIAQQQQDWAQKLFGMNFEEASRQLGRFQDYQHAALLRPRG